MSAAADQDPIPLETDVTAGAQDGGADRRPRLPEPLPVRLVAVEDVRLRAPRGVEEQLDFFYVGLLGFDRAAPHARAAGEEIVYRSETFNLRFQLTDSPLVHDTLRPQGIEVDVALVDLEKKFVEAELEFTRERGVTPGRETLRLLDPGGNWVEIGEIRLIT
ncbi:MAG: hypothetical protein QOF78_3528 [Phycisphaerales bacterium]|jgi:hypothetical protein|nr:hypothetical protein [Phycisphaerales bacterium]